MLKPSIRITRGGETDEAKLMSWAVFGYEIQNSKKKIRHLYGDLNLDEIKKHIATAVCKWRDESNL